MYKAIWLTWEKQVRNKSMSSILEADLFEIIYNGNRVKRYLDCAFKTISILQKERPKIVYAQNPSVVLNYLLIFTKLIFKYKLVSDAHFAGILACNGNKLLQTILDLCNKLVDLVIVTNCDHAEYVHKLGGETVICEDPLPDIERYRVISNNKDKTVLYICSYDVDEPYLAAFKAAELLAKYGYTFWATGNYKKVKINPNAFPFVKFLGYLPDSEFYANLFRCSVVLDLTENESCLVCGAYEAMAAEKPLITSDKKCLKNFFTKGTLFTKHDESSIANAIEQAYLNRDILIEEIKDWKKKYFIHQNERILKIFKQLGIETT